MIQRMSDQHKIHFLDNESSPKSEKKAASLPQKTLDQIAEDQKSKVLSNNDNGMMTSQHISSARTGSISNEGGPSTFVKSDSSNTIWENDKTAKESQKIDSKTKTIQEKSTIASNKREAENKRIADMTEVLKSTLQDKTATVSPAGTLSGTNYKASNNNMSIFDDKDFMRVDEKTAGEKVSDDLSAKKSQVDESWRNGGKTVSSKDVTNRLFDGLFKNWE